MRSGRATISIQLACHIWLAACNFIRVFCSSGVIEAQLAAHNGRGEQHTFGGLVLSLPVVCTTALSGDDGLLMPLYTLAHRWR
jgi:hypothetical protein